MREVKLKRYKNVIYELYCIETNTYYIGQTIKPLNDRISKHFSDAKRGREQILYEDIRKYGRSSFTYRVIEEVSNREELDDKERFWIDKYIKDGFALYNNEFGGRKDINVPYKTRVKMAQKKGTKPFVVYDINKKFIGKFEKIIDANNKLGTGFNNSMIRSEQHYKDLIAIYEEDFTKEKLDGIIKKLIIKDGKIKKYHDNSGKNNPMYNKGKHFYAYDSEKNFIKEYFKYSDCVNELGISVWSIKEYIDKDEPCKKGYYFTSKCA